MKWRHYNWEDLKLPPPPPPYDALRSYVGYPLEALSPPGDSVSVIRVLNAIQMSSQEGSNLFYMLFFYRINFEN